MQCPLCQHENPEGLTFCNQCGIPLSGHCAACGFTNPPGSKFCGACGTSFRRMPESRNPATAWTPACGGVTEGKSDHVILSICT